MLKDLVRIARFQEAVDRQMKVMATNVGADQVNAVRGNKRSGRNKICYGCGLEGNLSGDRKSSARGEACRKCGGS